MSMAWSFLSHFARSLPRNLGLLGMIAMSQIPSIPSLAQQAVPLQTAPIVRGQPGGSADHELPVQTAIVGKVLLDIVLDPGRKYDLPVTMLTALPVYDAQGIPVLPEGSLITALIQKKDGGDYITIDRIVYRGLNILLPSEGRLIPAQIKPENYGNYIIPPKTKASSVVSATDQSSFISTLLAIAIAGSYKNNEDGTQSQNITPLVLGVVGIDLGIKLIAALFDSAPQRLPPLVEIPKDSLIVFTLQNSVQLPGSNAPATVLPKDVQ